jgi:hypothetical protein
LKPKAVSLSNTYRALRFVGDATYGDLLYAEFTSQADWHYDTPVHYELFNMTEGETKKRFVSSSSPFCRFYEKPSFAKTGSG